LLGLHVAGSYFRFHKLLLHRLPQFFIRHVQIPLGRLEIRVTQQKLNRPQIQTT